MVRDGAGVRVLVTERMPGAFIPLETAPFGFGVMLRSAEGMRDLFCEFAGVFIFEDNLGRGAEASDIGGDGGSLIVGAPLLEGGKEISSGGVVIRGELAMERGESPNVGDSGIDISVEIVDK